jgi:transcriptional regulator with XRE-family HTH domain
LLISKRLLKAREKTGLSVRDVGRATGLSAGNISALEKGRYLPSSKALILLSKCYNVTADWILKGYEAFYDQQVMQDIMAHLIHDKQEWVLIKAIASLSKRETTKYALQSYMAEQDDPALKEMIAFLKTTWDCGDEKTKHWLEIQFQQCFPQYQQKDKETKE